MESTFTAIGVCTCRGWAEFPQLRSIRCMGPWVPFGCSRLRPKKALMTPWAIRQAPEWAVCQSRLRARGADGSVLLRSEPPGPG
jgi:hypothetical protein